MARVNNWRFHCPFCGTVLTVRPDPLIIGQYRNCFGCGEPFCLERKKTTLPKEKDVGVAPSEEETRKILPQKSTSNSSEEKTRKVFPQKKLHQNFPKTTKVPLGKEKTRAKNQQTLSGKRTITGKEKVERRQPQKNIVIDAYRIIKELGRGGMGAVYQARDTILNRDVALKTILYEDGSEIHVKRFLKEAQTSQALDHPNIVKVYDVNHEGELYYYTMELIRGTPLDVFIRKTPIDDIKSIEIVRKVAYAIDYAHKMKVLHRDLKPANIMMENNLEPKVVDFGLAKILKDTTEKLTASGIIVGTIQYMSPEQVSGEGDLKNSTDIYSLGVILYELLTGTIPFDDKSIIRLYDKINSEEPITPNILNPRIPKKLSQICMKAIAKKPEDRFANAKELGDALAVFLPS